MSHFALKIDIATANAVRTFLIPETVRLSAHGEALDSTPFFP